MSAHIHKRDNSRYCQLGPIGDRSYEVNVESGRVYWGVPREDIVSMGLLPEWNQMAFLSDKCRRSWAGEVIYLADNDISLFCEIYTRFVGHAPLSHVKDNGARSLISRLPLLCDPFVSRKDPDLPHCIPYSCSEERSDRTDITVWNPILQSVTDFVMYVLVHDLVDKHPAQGPRMLETSLRLLKVWIRSKTPKLSGTFYDDKTRLMWVYSLRTDFPTCPTCGRKFGMLRNIHLSKTYADYQPHCSSRCAKSDPYVIARYRTSCMANYGVDHPSKASKVRDKTRKTLLERYGATSVLAIPEFVEKFKDTSRKRYGTDYPAQNPLIYAKTKATNIKKFGVTNSMKSPIVRAKAKATLLNRYGVENPLQNPLVWEKAKKTMMERYGVEYPIQNPKIMDSIIEKRICNQRLKNRPRMDGLVFDSRWELLFYKFCKEHGLDVKYHPCYLIYVHDGRKHRYYPDFSVCGKLYEVKGDCFINSDGTWKCPFRKHGMTDEEYAISCSQIDAKRRCVIENGVTVVSRSEMRNLGKILGVD